MLFHDRTFPLVMPAMWTMRSSGATLPLLSPRVDTLSRDACRFVIVTIISNATLPIISSLSRQSLQPVGSVEIMKQRRYVTSVNSTSIKNRP